MTTLLKVIPKAELQSRRTSAIDSATLGATSSIVEDVKTGGVSAVRRYAEKFGERNPNDSLVIPREQLEAAFFSLSESRQLLLTRTKDRIASFARFQKESLSELTVPVAGGEAGHRILPIKRAGCYAPGGRYPLPSSVLMTAVTARVAGVSFVVACSPNPSIETLAAAFVADVDSFLAIGGAHAIAAMAYGFDDCDPVDVIVGPGNKWVTAAKKIVSGDVAIDMLAGPSELLVLADADTDPNLVAADLLAQAEHDSDAIPMVCCRSASFLQQVNVALEQQLATLPTADVARSALANGFGIVVDSSEELVEVANAIGAEHLQVMTSDSQVLAKKLTNFGGLFIGAQSAEVFGDYGAGPNHVLPTGGTSRYSGGLSVFTFLRICTWLEVSDESAIDLLADYAAELGRIEGLEGHARAALRRKKN